jgi:hypothetical protein
MEHLNKQQIVLLVILIGIVTSISTGIIIVSLTDDVSQNVPQTINRIIERTIEKAVPSENQNAAVITKETVVVRSDDQIVSAIAKANQSLVHIYTYTNATVGTFVGNGVIISKEGMVVSDASIISPTGHYAAIYNEKVFPLQLVTSQEDKDVAFFLMTAANTNDKVTIVPLTLAEGIAKLGQSIIAVSGKGPTRVAVGIVSELEEKEAPSTATSSAVVKKIVSAVKTDINPQDLLPGSLLLNLSGEMIAIRIAKVTEGEERIYYLPSYIIKKQIPTQ